MRSLRGRAADRLVEDFHFLGFHFLELTVVDDVCGEEIHNIALFPLNMFIHLLEIISTFTYIVHAIISGLLEVPSNQPLLFHVAQSPDLLADRLFSRRREVARIFETFLSPDVVMVALFFVTTNLFLEFVLADQKPPVEEGSICLFVIAIGIVYFLLKFLESLLCAIEAPEVIGLNGGILAICGCKEIFNQQPKSLFMCACASHG